MMLHSAILALAAFCSITLSIPLAPDSGVHAPDYTGQNEYDSDDRPLELAYSKRMKVRADHILHQD